MKKVENWQFCSLWRRLYGNHTQKNMLSEWPISEPKDYLSFVNTPQTKEEEGYIRKSVGGSHMVVIYGLQK